MKTDFVDDKLWKDSRSGHSFMKVTQRVEFTQRGSYYGIILSGQAAINQIPLLNTEFFCRSVVKEDDFITIQPIGRSAIIFVIFIPYYKCQEILGGRINIEKGKLKYIDGCTDSLLAGPDKWGEPCLNALYFPTNILQTFHTHPSYRAGCVIHGFGRAWVNVDDPFALETGDIFFLPKNELHRFETSRLSEMVIVAFHPDSDFGPKDEDHPMLNRTII